MTDDREIMSIYRSGDRDRAFRAIIESYRERLYWHIRRFTCSHEDTDDLLQETFVKIWTGLPDFREDARLFSWIYRIATNETLNFLRRKKTHGMANAEPLENILYRKVDDDPYFNGNQLQRELHKAIQKLPPRQKAVFNMRYFEEMPYNDMAEILGVSAGALKASYHHAYSRIKEELQKIF